MTASLKDLESLSLLLAAGAGDRWYVVLVIEARSFVAGRTPHAYATASVWREVDEDYPVEAAAERALIGNVVENADGPAVQVVEDVEASILDWFATLARKAGVTVLLPTKFVVMQRIIDGGKP